MQLFYYMNNDFQHNFINRSGCIICPVKKMKFKVLTVYSGQEDRLQ